jgi:hypothetical protein
MGPRFAAPGSFEYEYGTRWKQLYELKKQKEDALNREMKMEEEKLEAQMEYAKYEHETESLRDRKFIHQQPLLTQSICETLVLMRGATDSKHLLKMWIPLRLVTDFLEK